MNALKWSLLVYVVLAGKLALANTPASIDLFPDPILTLAILAIVALEHPLSFAVAASIGFAGDLLWGERVGISMLCLLVTGYWLGGIRRWFDLDAPVRSVSVAWFLATVVVALETILRRALGGGAYDLESLFVRSIVDGFLCGLVVYLLHLALEKTAASLRTIFQFSSN